MSRIKKLREAVKAISDRLSIDAVKLLKDKNFSDDEIKDFFESTTPKNIEVNLVILKYLIAAMAVKEGVDSFTLLSREKYTKIDICEMLNSQLIRFTLGT